MVEHGAGQVKICGLCRRDDVVVADEAGADYLGFIASEGFSRSVRPAELAELVAGVRATPVAVLVDETVEVAEARGRALDAGVLQLHGSEDPDRVRATREAGPWAVWKAVRVRSAEDVARAVERYAEVVDGLLVEGWKEGVQGGGGARLRPSVAARVRETIPPSLRFVLAGGLTHATVYTAVARFRPDVVDVSSGVESSVCRKNAESVRRFIHEARRAFHTDPESSVRQPGASS